jgi:hypothetical protein
MPRGRGSNGTGILLRDWLMKVREGTSTQFFQHLQGQKNEGYTIGTHKTVITLFWVVKTKLGLIEVKRIEKTMGNRKSYFYRIVPGYAYDVAWTDVYKFAYPEDYTNNEQQLLYWKLRKSRGGASVNAKELGKALTKSGGEKS